MTRSLVVGVRRTPQLRTVGVRRTLVKPMAKQTDTRRTPLNKPRVLEAAVALADQTGIDGFGMRRLAQELGVVPMALYKHVANKDELLNGMIDIVFGEIESPSIGGDWRAEMRRRALSAREALKRH